MGHEDILEDGHHSLAAKDRVAHVQGVGLRLADVAGLAALDVVRAEGVHRHRAVDGPGLFSLTHGHGGHGGHDQYFVGVEYTGLVQLSSADHHAPGPALLNPQEQVGV